MCPMCRILEWQVETIFFPASKCEMYICREIKIKMQVSIGILGNF